VTSTPDTDARLAEEILRVESGGGDPRERLRFAALAVATGVLAGALGSAFHLLIDLLSAWPAWLAQAVSGTGLVVAAALVTMTCAVTAAYLVRRFAPEAGGSGIQEIEGAMSGVREVRWLRVLPVKFFGGLIAISSGMVLGREGPTIHLGASAGAALADRYGVSELERRGLLASGAAAGLACAFNAPLASVLFIIEETRKQFPYTARTYLGVFLAVIAGTAVTQFIGGTVPDLQLKALDVSLTLLPAFLLLGAVLGAVGVALNASILGTVAFASRSHAQWPYIYPAVVGGLVGALMIVAPLAVTGGEVVIHELVAKSPGMGLLLMLAVVRFVTMVGSYSSGVPGGIFAPILALAVCIGLAFGDALGWLLPTAGATPVAFAIAAMAGLFTASVRSPIVAVVLALELTGSYVLCLHVMATCVAAEMSAKACGGRPIYEQLLERTLRQDRPA